MQGLQIHRAVLTCDRHAFATCGAKDRMLDGLGMRPVATWSPTGKLPLSTDALELARLIQQSGADGLVAVGGGTVLDASKLGLAMAAQPGKAIEFVTQSLDPGIRLLPWIAIPTTAGTGAEATRFAVVYHGGRKYSVSDPRLLPAGALIDPSLCDSLPRHIRAHTGFDALAQAIESLWAQAATPESRSFARHALRLAAGHLERAVLREDTTARDAMSEAAHYAGRAIDISRTTLPHALSYTLSADYEVPHGQAVGVFLPPVLLQLAELEESECNHPRGASYVSDRVWEICGHLGAGDPRDAANWLTELMQACGMATRLGALGVRSQEERRKIATGVNLDRLGNHPQHMDPARLRNLVEAVR